MWAVGCGLSAMCAAAHTDEASVPPCVTRRVLGQGTGVAAFEELTRDTHTFSRRVGDLPVQREGDAMDFRPLLHRWGLLGTLESAECLSNLGAGVHVVGWDWDVGALTVCGGTHTHSHTHNTTHEHTTPTPRAQGRHRLLRRFPGRAGLTRGAVPQAWRQAGGRHALQGHRHL